jgi:uncharacterized repeat protein (TIGR02543 family)
MGAVAGRSAGADQAVGGIVSRNQGTVSNCYNAGTVRCDTDYYQWMYRYYPDRTPPETAYEIQTAAGNIGYAGGIAGQQYGEDAALYNCYSAATPWKDSYVTYDPAAGGTSGTDGYYVGTTGTSIVVAEDIIGALGAYPNAPTAPKDAVSCTMADKDMRTEGFVDTINEGDDVFARDTLGGNGGFPVFRQAWSLNNTFYIEYDEGDGVMPKDAASGKSVVNGEAYGELPEPEPPMGYVFEGWHLGDVDGAAIADTTIVNLEEDETLYARYDERTYHFILDTGDRKVDVSVTYEDLYDALGGVDIPEKPGYDFGGWFTAAGGEGKLVDEDSLLEIEDTSTLFAYWIPKDVTVYFEKNGKGARLEIRSKYIAGAAGREYGVLPVPSRTGYTFLGWYTHKDAGDEVGGESIVSAETGEAGEQILYAHWEARQYTVKFNANKGNELTRTSTAVTFDHPFGKLPRATRKGHKFLGWYTRAKYGTRVTAKSIATQRTIYVTRTTVLYAHWKKLVKYGKIIKTKEAGVYSEPSLESSLNPAVGKLKKGRTFKIRAVIGKKKTERWYKLTYKGKTAYVPAKFVKVVYK